MYTHTYIRTYVPLELGGVFGAFLPPFLLFLLESLSAMLRLPALVHERVEGGKVAFQRQWERLGRVWYRVVPVVLQWACGCRGVGGTVASVETHRLLRHRVACLCWDHMMSCDQERAVVGYFVFLSIGHAMCAHKDDRPSSFLLLQTLSKSMRQNRYSSCRLFEPSSSAYLAGLCQQHCPLL